MIEIKEQNYQELLETLAQLHNLECERERILKRVNELKVIVGTIQLIENKNREESAKKSEEVKQP